MHIEKRRKRNREYAYESFRVDGRVVTRYVGRIDNAGVKASLEYDGLREANRRRVKLRRNEEREAAIDCERSLVGLDSMNDRWNMLRSLLDRSGKGTVMPLGRRDEGDENIVGDVVDAVKALPTRTEFGDLCIRVDSGDEAALRHFRCLVNGAPELFDDLIDLIAITREQTVAMIAGDSIAARHLVDLQLTREIDAIMPSGELTVVKRMQAEVMLLQRLDFLRCHTALSRTPENQSDFRFWSGMTIRAKGRYQRAVREWSKSRS